MEKYKFQGNLLGECIYAQTHTHPTHTKDTTFSSFSFISHYGNNFYVRIFFGNMF